MWPTCTPAHLPEAVGGVPLNVQARGAIGSRPEDGAVGERIPGLYATRPLRSEPVTRNDGGRPPQARWSREHGSCGDGTAEGVAYKAAAG
jgi:hypothetical protein